MLLSSCSQNIDLRVSLFVANEAHLCRAVSAHVTCCNCWRPHRSLGQRALFGSTVLQFLPREEIDDKIIAESTLGGLHQFIGAAP
jgi:hypothetical protein